MQTNTCSDNSAPWN